MLLSGEVLTNPRSKVVLEAAALSKHASEIVFVYTEGKLRTSRRSASKTNTICAPLLTPDSLQLTIHVEHLLGWDFNAFYMSDETAVKASIAEHEALKFRPKSPASVAYEHVAMCHEIIRRMGSGTRWRLAMSKEVAAFDGKSKLSKTLKSLSLVPRSLQRQNTQSEAAMAHETRQTERRTEEEEEEEEEEEREVEGEEERDAPAPAAAAAAAGGAPRSRRLSAARARVSPFADLAEEDANALFAEVDTLTQDDGGGG